MLDRKNNNDRDQKKKTKTTFLYYSPLVHKITNIFKHINVRISFKSTKTIQHLTKPKPTSNI
jgi:hypothetical protein